MSELRTNVQMLSEKSFLGMQLERERLWLAVLQQAICERDNATVSFPLCIDLAVNVEEVGFLKPMRGQ